jgi:RNA polymerase sigma factor (sigma-70 family)
MELTSNRQLFARLYDEFMPRVFAYIHYKVASDHLTEDLTSIVFEKALTNFARYSQDKSAFSTWIFTIARNTVIDYFRTESKRKNIDLDEIIDIPASTPSPEEQFEHDSEKECLLSCLSRIGEQDREILQLKFGAELTNREISRILKISESNVGVRLFRSVKKLREDFEEKWHG